MKRCSTSHVIRELQTKIMRYHYTSIRIAKSEMLATTKCQQGLKQQEYPFTKGRNAKWHNHFGRQVESFLQNWTYSYCVIQ